MCAPAVMLGVAAVTTGVGSLYSASQERAAGKAEQSFYQAQADAAQQQGEIARQVGAQRDTLAQDEGARNSKANSRAYAVQTAAARAALAANGQTGSVGEQNILRDTTDKRAMDEAVVKYNADSKSWEAKTNAEYENWTDQTRAGQLRTAGTNARRAANARATSTLLGGASSIAGMGLTYAYNK